MRLFKLATDTTKSHYRALLNDICLRPEVIYFTKRNFTYLRCRCAKNAIILIRSALLRRETAIAFIIQCWQLKMPEWMSDDFQLHTGATQGGVESRLMKRKW